MAGEHGTQIRDNIRTNTLLNENQNRHHLAVSLYENTVYRIRIELSCFQDSNRGLSGSNCNLAKDVDVSIDLNNNGVYEASESRTPQRWPLLSSMPLGIYDWEIRIPAINEQYTTIGSHQMRIIVTPSDEYVKKCGNSDSTETRYYTVNVISKTRHQGNTLLFNSIKMKINSHCDFIVSYHFDLLCIETKNKRST